MLIFVGIVIEIFAQKVIFFDLILIKKMLKFLPLSFAKNSEGVKQYIYDISHQRFGITY